MPADVRRPEQTKEWPLYANEWQIDPKILLIKERVRLL
jgi:hypothetical protein